MSAIHQLGNVDIRQTLLLHQGEKGVGDVLLDPDICLFSGVHRGLPSCDMRQITEVLSHYDTLMCLRQYDTLVSNYIIRRLSPSMEQSPALPCVSGFICMG